MSNLTLYVYDHCPYCVKARMIFGWKQVPFELVTLLNDDVDTPTKLIGQKMVPILVKEDGTAMPESMDIVHYIDQNYSSDPILAPSMNHAPLTEWLSNIRGCLYKLAMPRWVMPEAGLEEFETQGARDFFTNKKEAMIGSFADNLANSDVLKAEANELLQGLESIIQSEDAVHGRLSEDDIHLFAILRSLSIVQGLTYPTNVEAYRQRVANDTNIPLHDNVAIA